MAAGGCPQMVHAARRGGAAAGGARRGAGGARPSLALPTRRIRAALARTRDSRRLRLRGAMDRTPGKLPTAFEGSPWYVCTGRHVRIPAMRSGQVNGDQRRKSPDPVTTADRCAAACLARWRSRGRVTELSSAGYCASAAGCECGIAPAAHTPPDCVSQQPYLSGSVELSLRPSSARARGAFQHGVPARCKKGAVQASKQRVRPARRWRGSAVARGTRVGGANCRLHASRVWRGKQREGARGITGRHGRQRWAGRPGARAPAPAFAGAACSFSLGQAPLSVGCACVCVCGGGAGSRGARARARAQRRRLRRGRPVCVCWVA